MTKAQIRKRERKLNKRENRNRLKEWVRLVKERDNYSCVICGKQLGKEIIKPNGLNAHHIVPKSLKELKYDLTNGITICAWHHSIGPWSAHKNAIYFNNWLEINREIEYYYLMNKIENIIKKPFAASY